MIRPVRQDGTIETGGPFVPIRRSRVVERIASAATQRVALIVAPAGYGKSVALRQFLETVERPFVRYDVRAEHNELLGFLRGLCDALGDQAPYARAALAGAYERNMGSESPGLDLAQWMHTHLETYRGVIAIDDLHIAQGDREVTRFLTSLIERTKGRIEWIIASRTTQGLPIGTWLAYGESDLSIDEHDLRFTVEEAKDAARSCRLGVREDELYDLLQLTEGWAIAVSFALRTSTRSIDLRAAAAITREMIYRYLAEQVYGRLSEEERMFLETAALLGEIDPEVMVAAGFDRTVAIVEDICERVAFMQLGKDGIYRCHDLFREFLLHQIGRRGEHVINTRREELAAILEGLGRTSAALRVYVDSACVIEIQRMLGKGFDLLEEGQGDLVLAALAVLERDSSAVTPIAAALRGVIQIAAGRFDDGERRLLSCLPLVTDAAVFGRVSLKLAMLNVNRLSDPAPILDRLFSREDVLSSTRAEAKSILAVHRARVDRPEDALTLLREVERETGETADDTVRARLLQRLGVANHQLHRGAEARLLLEESANLAERHHLWSVKSRALNSLALVLMNTSCDTSAALECTQDAASAARKAGDYLDLQTSLLMSLTIEVRRGNQARVREIEQELGSLRAADRGVSVFVVSSQAHRAAWEGRMGDAHRLLSSIIQRQPHEVDRAMTQVIYGLCLAMDYRFSDSRTAIEGALTLIEAAHVRADSMDSLFFEVAMLFCALAEIISGRMTSATRILKKTPLSTNPVAASIRECVNVLGRQAKDRGHEAGIPIDQLNTLVSRGFGGYARYIELAQRLLLDRRYISEKLSDGEIEDLTGVELRILRDLANGFSTKEIAAEMGRSLLTVQTHIKCVVQKLGCRGRGEAISTAKRLGLFKADA